MNKHSHRCGMRGASSDTDPKEEGCGWEWEHEDVSNESTAEYHARHMCPNCGSGPWLTTETTVVVIDVRGIVGLIAALSLLARLDDNGS